MVALSSKLAYGVGVRFTSPCGSQTRVDFQAPSTGNDDYSPLNIKSLLLNSWDDRKSKGRLQIYALAPFCVEELNILLRK
jgi:hypothetical protein